MNALAGIGIAAGVIALAVTAMTSRQQPRPSGGGRHRSRPSPIRHDRHRPRPRAAAGPASAVGSVPRGPAVKGHSAVGRWLVAGRNHRPAARWARPADLRPLALPGHPRYGRHRAESCPPGRIVLGRVGRRLVAAERAQSVIVFGPTQSRKTTGFAVPAILGWHGPVLATSVKTDLVGDTLAYRRRCGQVWCFDPSGATGLPSASWSPLPASRTWPGARRAASALTDVGKGIAGGMADGDFWYSAAAKMLAPLLFAAATAGQSMSDVIRWVETQEFNEVLGHLEAAGVPEAVNAALSLFGKEDRQRSSIVTTVETLLEPFADLDRWDDHHPVGEGGPGERDAERDAALDPSGAIDPARLIAGNHTLYLCAPAHDQRRLSPLFTAVVRQVVEHVFDVVTCSGRPLDPPLLIVLDEAANIAPLSDLDALASTAAGHGIQLVTVWHDLAQITARFGPRAATVVNNHRAKVFLSGISDPSTLEHASALIGDEELLLPAFTSGGPGMRSTTQSPTSRRLVPPDALRRIPPGEGIVVYGSLPPAWIRLRTWYDDPELAVRAGASAVPGVG